MSTRIPGAATWLKMGRQQQQPVAAASLIRDLRELISDHWQDTRPEGEGAIAAFWNAETQLNDVEWWLLHRVDQVRWGLTVKHLAEHVEALHKFAPWPEDEHALVCSTVHRLSQLDGKGRGL
jgi:hypothetical protein